MEVVKFTIEESTFNKGQLILIAETENNRKFVVSGDHYSPTYLVPYETANDVIEHRRK